MSSLAQDEIGHAAALYGLLGELTGTDPDVLAYDREPAEYRHCRLLDHGRGDWAMTIARRYLYETADAVRLEALVGGSWAPLADLSGKLVREERYHLMHVNAWFGRLAGTRGEPRDRLLAALDVLAPDAATVFTPLPGEGALIEAGHPGRADDRAGGSLARVHRAGVRSAPHPDHCRRRPTGRADARITGPSSTGSGASSTPSDGAIQGRPGERGRDPGRHRPNPGRGRRRGRLGRTPGRRDGGPARAGRGHGPRTAGRLDRRSGHRPSRGGSSRWHRRDRPADVRRLPRARDHPGGDRRSTGRLRPPGPTCRLPSTSRGHRIGSSPAGLDALARVGIAPPGPQRRGPLPAVRLAGRRDGQPVRADAMPLALLLPSLPPAVRSHQAGLTWVRTSARSGSSARARWAPASRRWRWRRATRSGSTTSRSAHSKRRPARINDGLARRAATTGRGLDLGRWMPGSTRLRVRPGGAGERIGPRHRGRHRGARCQAGDLPNAGCPGTEPRDPGDQHERAVRDRHRGRYHLPGARARPPLLQPGAGHAPGGGRGDGDSGSRGRGRSDRTS